MIRLYDIAHSRAGDKGDISNVSVIARQPEHWTLIQEYVTTERVLEVFGPLGATRVERFELPKLHALNFVIHDALGGGVNRSLAVDRHGKTLSFLLLAEVFIDGHGSQGRINSTALP